MREIELGKTGMNVPCVGIGCMRIADMEVEDIADYIRFCVQHGFTFFDHADIYGGGTCESKFGKALKLTGIDRDKIFIQSKCGIIPGKMYDLSKDYILKSVDGILERLDCGYLDVLLLHRPDAWMEPEEVAEAFNILKESGKVKAFGVSNFRPRQIDLLQSRLDFPLAADQLQYSIPFSNMIAQGLEANMETPGSIDHDGGVLEYCRLHNLTIQTWSPFQFGNWQGTFMNNLEKFPKLNETMNELAKKYGVSNTAIATSWILSHPAKMQMLAGTTNQKRLLEILEGTKIKLTKEEWYRLYLDAGHILP